jgi:TIR domain-containing protein
VGVFLGHPPRLQGQNRRNETSCGARCGTQELKCARSNMAQPTIARTELLALVLEGVGDRSARANAELFRADHEDDRGDLDELVRLGFLYTEEGGYVLSLLALDHLAAKGSAAADVILRFCGKLFAAMRALYKREGRRQFTSAEIAGEVGSSEDKAQRGLTYLSHAPIWQGTQGSNSALTHVTPRDAILDYKSLDEVVEYFRRNRESQAAAFAPISSTEVVAVIRTEPVLPRVSARSDVFMCYARSDLDTALRLKAVLGRRGWSVFIDRQTPIGDRWHKAIERELHAARVVVALWSTRSRESDFVLEEADFGRKRGNLFPAWIERVEVPYGFGRVQTADLVGWTDANEPPGLPQLIGALSGVLDATDDASPRARPAAGEFLRTPNPFDDARPDPLGAPKPIAKPGAGPELAIIVGQDGPYVETASHALYNVRKTVSIGVKNIGDTYLTNCKVHLAAPYPETGKPERWLLDGPFSLNQGEERYIAVAAYNEPVPPHPQSAEMIRLSAPPSGTFWRPPEMPASGGVLTIHAASAESRPCEVICKLWVADGSLRWQKA